MTRRPVRRAPHGGVDALLGAAVDQLVTAVGRLEPYRHTADLAGQCAECACPLSVCPWQPVLRAIEDVQVRRLAS